MRVLAIDPGPTTSGAVLCTFPLRIHYADPSVPTRHLADFLTYDNCRRPWAGLDNGRLEGGDVVLLEKIVHYGGKIHAGADTFETCYESGIIARSAELSGVSVYRIDRREIKLHLCGNPRAKDPEIRTAIVDRYGGGEKAIGGIRCRICKGKGSRGRERAMCQPCAGSGWQAPRGPLYDISSHAWSALALAVTWWDLNAGELLISKQVRG